ncbi:hypothetical protein [Roseovarius salis]|uniref:hypothetical protein n=1 Tax=Roseovarius salis TaxID=3376063 RepID=UPI0037C92F06
MALRVLFGLEWPRAARLAIFVNLISMFGGIVIYPVAGLVLYPLLEPLVVMVFGRGDMVEFSSYALGVGVVDTGVELVALASFFGVAVRWRSGLGFLLANLLTAALLVGVIVWQNTPAAMPRAEAQAVQDTYAQELSFLEEVLAGLPRNVSVPDGAEGFPDFDDAELERIRTRMETLRLRTISLSVPLTTFFGIGITALMQIDARYRDGGLTIERGLMMAAFTAGRAVGAPVYRVQLERRVDDVTFAVAALLSGQAVAGQ